jgi:hypothetical protein
MSRPLDLAALERAYREALDCQDACNLSGVVRSFARHTEALWAEADAFGQGTEYVNTHPVTLWFLDKLNDLARRPDVSRMIRAHSVIQQINEGRVALGSDEHKQLVQD